MAIVIDTPIRFQRGSRHAENSATVELTTNQSFLEAALCGPKRLHYSSRDKLHVVSQPQYSGSHDDIGYPVSTVSLGFQAIHQAFAAHMPLSLRPDTLWYMIVHEVAEHVRQNSGRYANLFTNTPESKQTIKVRDDSLRYDAPSDWMRTINLFRSPLAAKLTDGTAALFLPRFSTSTIEDETALLVALMDAASPYYEYVVETKCGIPQIRLEGNAADWAKLHRQVEQLAGNFGGLNDYFKDLLPVLQTIAETSSGSTPNDSFWRSIYKYENDSGGPRVTGWITAFFAYIQTKEGSRLKDRFNWRLSSSYGGYKTDQFPSHLSRVPFVWDYLGTEYDMAFAAGITGVDYDDNFLSPRLGFAVAEV